MARATKLMAVVCAGVVSGMVGSAHGQIVQPPCVGFFNSNFSSGSAFWSVDQQIGGWGDSFGGIFTSFSPLSLVPATQANVATFFTEAFAAGDCENPLGSAHNSQFILGRTLTSVPSSGRLRFKFGAQISYVLVNQSSVQYQLRVIVRNLSTGAEVKCKVASGGDKISNGQVKESIFTVPFQTYNACNCATNGLYSPGQIVEILAIGVVQANANEMGQSAFIGGPIFWDDFEFCNVLCPIISDPPVKFEVPVQVDGLVVDGGEAPQGDLSGSGARVRALAKLDLDGDGMISEQEWVTHGLLQGGVPSLIDADADLNGDGVVDQKDVDMLIGMINGTARPLINADLNGDSIVDARDLEMMLDALR